MDIGRILFNEEHIISSIAWVEYFLMKYFVKKISHKLINLIYKNLKTKCHFYNLGGSVIIIYSREIGLIY
jgi:hypothetical protein